MIVTDAIWIIALTAIVLDAVFGEPDWLWSRIPHPVVALGRLIGAADRRFNRQEMPERTRRQNGVLFIAVLYLGSLVAGGVVEDVLLALPLGWLAVAGLAATLIAQRSLYDHVVAVAAGLETGGLKGGREAVAMIVGRDPEQLDESGVARAAIESCAENFSDGVVAPVFWFLLFGLGGLLAYKAINTADSMIGYRTARHEAYGYGSAKLDDWINLIPARLSGILVALGAVAVGGSPGESLTIMRRDARKHRSPNAGWPEAAMAGALGIALAGPRVYASGTVDDPYLNADGRHTLTAKDIRRCLSVFAAACLVQAALIGLIAIA